MPMTREEHLQWAKNRALAYIDRGQPDNAWLSMCSDLRKHEQLREHIGIELGMAQLLSGFLDTTDEMKRFIEGFN